MSILSATYNEYPNEARAWGVEKAEFAGINLIVGKNSTGKSRLINLISSFCRVLGSPGVLPFDSGRYSFEVALDSRIFEIEIDTAGGKVLKESLKVDGVTKMTRDSTGVGEIYYEKQGEFIEFQIPDNAFAFQQKQDELQHPFIVELANWARRTQFFSFNTSFANNSFVAWSSFNSTGSANEHPNSSSDVVMAYGRAFNQFGVPFDSAIIDDMKRLDYDISDVGSDDMRSLVAGLNAAEPVLGLYVRECDRDNAMLPQHLMSTGMFRALALVIFSNIAKFSQSNTVLAIDDIGEGLDYQRSVALIEILQEHVATSKLQLFMSTNDKFVMNAVDLKYWTILKRTRGKVKPFNYKNSKDMFDEFKFIGLNNFDFFSDAEFGIN